MNISFSGPWSGFNCSDPKVQVDIFGVLGQVLVKDFETAFWINSDKLQWNQPPSGENLAGIPDTFARYWAWDSGDVHC